MHPRESIPNVGRRAHGRKALFLLKGNSIDSNGTKVPVPRIDLTPDDDTPLVPFGADIPVSVPSHPYNGILQRIMRRHQETNNNQVKVKVPDLTSSQKVTPRGFYTETGLLTPRDSFRNQTEGQWYEGHQGTIATERMGKAAEDHYRQLYRLRAQEQDSHPYPAQQPRSHHREGIGSLKYGHYIDDRGCFTERVQRRQAIAQGRWPPKVLPEKKGTPDSIVSMTSRSEGGDSLRSSREGGDSMRNARVTLKQGPESLDDLLDYFWVYQGMGRQVLNLDLAGASWERKLFRKSQQLPPIARSYDHKRTAVTAAEDDATARALSDQKRVQSEPPIVGNSCVRDRDRDRDKEKNACSDEGTSKRQSVCKKNETKAEKETDTSPLVPDQQGKLRLVIKMPVLLKDATRSDTMFE